MDNLLNLYSAEYTYHDKRKPLAFPSEKNERNNHLGKDTSNRWKEAY